MNLVKRKTLKVKTIKTAINTPAARGGTFTFFLLSERKEKESFTFLS